jgi:SulP family sulfate permease
VARADKRPERQTSYTAHAMSPNPDNRCAAIERTEPPYVASRWKDALPITRLFEQSSRKSLGGDVVGGISACVVMIPSVIAYADLAGLPPAHGLYAALAGMLGYAAFASSRQVIAGPDAAIALLVASAVQPLAAGDPARTTVLCAVTALLAGIIMLIAARFRLAMIADFLSKPVLVGYMTGAALILVSTQLDKLFGLKLHEHDFFPLLAELAAKLPETHIPTLALAIGCLALLGAMRRVAPRLPGALVVFVLGIAASAAFGFETLGVRVVGNVPSGLPHPVLPLFSSADVRDLLPGAIGIALLTFPEGILLARAFAAKNGYDVAPEHELRALGAANLVAGLFQGFPVGASQTRTTVNDAAGGRTQLASLVAASALVVVLLFLTPLLRLLPMATLGAIVVFAGTQLVDLGEYARLYRIARLGFVNALLVTLWRAAGRRRARDRGRRHAVPHRAARPSRAAGGRRPAAGAGDRELSRCRRRVGDRDGARIDRVPLLRAARVRQRRSLHAARARPRRREPDPGAMRAGRRPGGDRGRRHGRGDAESARRRA